MNKLTTKWLIPLNKWQNEPIAKIIFFPYAGGHSYSYSPLVKPLSLHNCLGIELAGKGMRMDEVPDTDMKIVVENISSVLANNWYENMILFGHSMGALMAFECARTLEIQHQKKLKGLIISGQCAPSCVKEIQYLDCQASDEAIIEYLKKSGKTEAAIFENAEMRKLIVSYMKADLRINASYCYQPMKPLSCPIAYISAENDEIAPERHCDDWRRETSSAFYLQKISSGHFAIFEQADVLKKIMDLILSEGSKNNARLAC